MNKKWRLLLVIIMTLAAVDAVGVTYAYGADKNTIIFSGAVTFVVSLFGHLYLSGWIAEMQLLRKRCDTHEPLLQKALDFMLSKQEIKDIFNECISMGLNNGLGKFIDNRIEVAFLRNDKPKKKARRKT